MPTNAKPVGGEFCKRPGVWSFVHILQWKNLIWLEQLDNQRK
jgi:hypothetical protein